MTVTAITAYSFSIFIHITAVMVGFGSTFALAVATPVALKLDPRHLPYVHQLSIVLNRFFASPALLIVIVTGFYQVSEGNFSFGDAWISATFAIVIALGAIMGAVFMPSAKRLKALAERDIAAARRRRRDDVRRVSGEVADREHLRPDHRAAARRGRLPDGRQAGHVTTYLFTCRLCCVSWPAGQAAGLAPQL